MLKFQAETATLLAKISKKFMEYAPYLLVLLPVLWIAGVHTVDISRLLLLVYFFVIWKRQDPIQSFYFVPKFSKLFACLFPFMIWMNQMVRVFAGNHGLDFSIFSQVVKHIASTGIPMTSLTSPGWRNFLTHHLSPWFN